VATISGLVEQRNSGARKTMKQVTFSTDLIYDVMRKYDPNHVLLSVTRNDAERELLDTERLSAMLYKFQQRHVFKSLPRPSPLSLPIILDVRTERLPGRGMELLLHQTMQQETAEIMIEQVRDAVA
jgi:ATP-dependent Lhr-like helicase